MTGILHQHNEIENLRNEYKAMALRQFKPEHATEISEELILEECEL